MADFSLDNMSDLYFDVLKEIGNIGAGNATTALAQLVQAKVDMQVPIVKLLEFRNIGEVIGGEEQLMAGIYLGVEGDITGSIMFMIEVSAAKHLVERLMGMPSEGEGFSEMEASALQEIGNIISGSYLNSLATLTNFTILPTTPALAVDMAGAILSVPASQFGIYGDRLLFIQTRFTDDIEINGYFILIPDLSSYEKILRSLGIPLP